MLFTISLDNPNEKGDDNEYGYMQLNHPPRGDNHNNYRLIAAHKIADKRYTVVHLESDYCLAFYQDVENSRELLELISTVDVDLSMLIKPLQGRSVGSLPIEVYNQNKLSKMIYREIVIPKVAELLKQANYRKPYNCCYMIKDAKYSELHKAKITTKEASYLTHRKALNNYYDDI